MHTTLIYIIFLDMDIDIFIIGLLTYCYCRKLWTLTSKLSLVLNVWIVCCPLSLWSLSSHKQYFISNIFDQLSSVRKTKWNSRSQPVKIRLIVVRSNNSTVPSPSLSQRNYRFIDPNVFLTLKVVKYRYWKGGAENFYSINAKIDYFH